MLNASDNVMLTVTNDNASAQYPLNHSSRFPVYAIVVKMYNSASIGNGYIDLAQIVSVVTFTRRRF